MPSSPMIASTGTRTFLSVTSAWSDGMLNVHHMNSTLKPGVLVGTMIAVMPLPSPGLPEVRANTMSWVARCRPLLKRLAPLITHSSPSRTAVVSSQVASEPWLGSVRPNAMRTSPVNIRSRYSSFCSGRPNSSIISTTGKLPTIDDSFCRSLCRPSPLAARCSRMIAIAEIAAVLTAQPLRQREAVVAGAIGAPPHLGEQLLPLPARNAAVLPVGARVLAAVVEVLEVLLLERLDLLLDEGVELAQLVPDLAGDLEVHGGSPD